MSLSPALAQIVSKPPLGTEHTVARNAYILNSGKVPFAGRSRGGDHLRTATSSRLEVDRRIMCAQEEERARIARELHDDIGQCLALCNAQLATIRLSLGQRPEETVFALENLSKNIQGIGIKVSNLSHRLYSPELDCLGFVVAAKGLCREFSQSYQINIAFVSKGTAKDMRGDIALGFFRVLQEALHNAEKYSRSEQITVTLSHSRKALRLTIVDDGVGFNVNSASRHHGLGLTSMRQRLRLLGGSLKIWSAPGHGTKIEAHVPMC
jgi:signal transduction histidine kinase